VSFAYNFIIICSNDTPVKYDIHFLSEVDVQEWLKHGKGTERLVPCSQGTMVTCVTSLPFERELTLQCWADVARRLDRALLFVVVTRMMGVTGYWWPSLAYLSWISGHHIAVYVYDQIEHWYICGFSIMKEALNE